MHKNRRQKDGSYRDSDNWQIGIPFTAYAKSLWRHFHAFWKRHRGYTANESLEDSLCAIIFNASGYLHEVLKKAAETPMVRVAGISEAELIEEMKRPSKIIVPLDDVEECRAGSKAWLKNLEWTNGRWVPAYDQHIGAGYPLGQDAE